MKNSVPWRKLAVPVVFWNLAIWACLASDFTQPLILFDYIGTSLGLGLGLYAILLKQESMMEEKIRCSWQALSSSLCRSSWRRRIRTLRGCSFPSWLV